MGHCELGDLKDSVTSLGLSFIIFLKKIYLFLTGSSLLRGLSLVVASRGWLLSGRAAWPSLVTEHGLSSCGA